MSKTKAKARAKTRAKKHPLSWATTKPISPDRARIELRKLFESEMAAMPSDAFIDRYAVILAEMSKSSERAWDMLGELFMQGGTDMLMRAGVYLQAQETRARTQSVQALVGAATQLNGQPTRDVEASKLRDERVRFLLDLAMDIAGSIHAAPMVLAPEHVSEGEDEVILEANQPAGKRDR